jgi:hypothetical protein
MIEYHITKIEEYNKKLLDSMKETVGSRFNASKRLNYLDKSLTLLNAFASGYLIWISIWMLGRDLCPVANVIATLLSSGLAILFLCVSILVYAERFGLKAYLHNQCALELNHIYQSFRAVHATATLEEHLEHLRKYQTVLSKYPDNHADLDHRRYRFTYQKVDMNAFEYWLNRFRISLADYYALFILMVVTLVVGVTIGWIEFFTPWTSCAV